MSNDYKVRPMGADPRTSVTITDREIIYKNGLIGSNTKRLPLADARVEYSSLIRGGELVVKDHGSEVFRVGGIINPQAFYEEFDRRKNGLASNVQQDNSPSPSLQTAFKASPSTPDNFQDGITEYEYGGRIYKKHERDQVIEMALYDIGQAMMQPYAHELGCWERVLDRPPSNVEKRDAKVSVGEFSIERRGSDSPSKNRDQSIKNMYQNYEDGKTPYICMDYPTKEKVYGLGRSMAYGLSYVPECDMFAVNIYYRRRGEPERLKDTEHFTTLEGAIDRVTDSYDGNRKALRFIWKASAIVGAAIFAASMAFAEETPAQDAYTPADQSEYTIQIEP